MAWTRNNDSNTPNNGPVNNGPVNNGTFTVTVQSESNYGGPASVVVSTITDGRATTIADVRNVYGPGLNLNEDHTAWINGVSCGDDYEPAAGSLVTFKRAAKDRGTVG